VSTYQWIGAYQRAETEQDMSKLHECVMAVENMLFIRMQDLSAIEHSSPEVKTELADIRAAVTGLLRIKTEKLKWPGLDFDATQSSSAN
jgi:hypothetical protein